MQSSLFPSEISPDTVLEALVKRCGPANGASAKVLASEILGTVAEAADERALRQAIEKLRTDGHAICATPEQGYFHAATADDINRTCTFLLKRCMSSLRQIAAMKRVALPDLAGQLGLTFIEPKGTPCNTTTDDTTSSTKEV